MKKMTCKAFSNKREPILELLVFRLWSRLVFKNTDWWFVKLLINHIGLVCMYENYSKTKFCIVTWWYQLKLRDLKINMNKLSTGESKYRNILMDIDKLPNWNSYSHFTFVYSNSTHNCAIIFTYAPMQRMLLTSN